MFHIRDAPEVIKLQYWPPKADKAGPGRRDHGGPTSHSGPGYTQSSVVSTAGKCLAAQTPPDDHFWLTDEGASNPRLEGERADVGILIGSRCGGENTHTHSIHRGLIYPLALVDFFAFPHLITIEDSPWIFFLHHLIWTTSDRKWRLIWFINAQ